MIFKNSFIEILYTIKFTCFKYMESTCFLCKTKTTLGITQATITNVNSQMPHLSFLPDFDSVGLTLR